MINFVRAIVISIFPLITAQAVLAQDAEPVKPAAVNLISISGDPYAAMNRGASIYLVSIADHSKENSKPGVIAGIVKLKVQSTLLGKDRETITLPYSLRDSKTPSRRPITEIWPDLDELKPDATLLVVVAPGPFTNDPKDAAEQACNVYVLTGPNDPVLSSYRHIAELSKIKLELLKSALLKSAGAQPGQPEFDYIYQAAMARLGTSEAIEVNCKMLTSFDTRSPPAVNVMFTLNSLQGLLKKPGVTKADEIRILMAMGQLLDTPIGNAKYIDSNRYIVLNRLSALVQILPASAELLSIEQRETLNRDIKKAEDNQPVPSDAQYTAWIAEMRSWLGKAQ